jgi:adenine deaminase
MGSLKVGKDADIVVWSENPLSIYAKVEQTYIDGNCYFDLTQNLLNKERDNREKIRIIKKLSKRKEKSKTKYKPTKEKLYHCDSIEHE